MPPGQEEPTPIIDVFDGRRSQTYQCIDGRPLHRSGVQLIHCTGTYAVETSILPEQRSWSPLRVVADRSGQVEVGVERTLVRRVVADEDGAQKTAVGKAESDLRHSAVALAGRARESAEGFGVPSAGDLRPQRPLAEYAEASVGDTGGTDAFLGSGT